MFPATFCVFCLEAVQYKSSLSSKDERKGHPIADECFGGSYRRASIHTCLSIFFSCPVNLVTQCNDAEAGCIPAQPLAQGLESFLARREVSFCMLFRLGGVVS